MVVQLMECALDLSQQEEVILMTLKLLHSFELGCFQVSVL